MKKKDRKQLRDLTNLIASLKDQDFCYLTTIGRVSGRPHEIEIWFGAHNNTLYLLAGDARSDWVKNLLKDPSTIVRIAKHTFRGTGRVVKDLEEERRARYLVAEKYQEMEDGKTLSQWARTALPVGIDVDD